MSSNAFAFNTEAKYQVGVQQPPVESWPSFTKAQVQVQATSGASFETQYPDVFENYRVPNVSSDKIVQAWNSTPMQFWQNQLNFAVWCATSGCGVSVQDHLNADVPLLHALYRFHVYYQTRRILKEIQASLPQDQAWQATNNSYDRRAYERICSEFGISPHTDWRVKGPNHGLGRVYFYVTHVGYRPVYGAGDPNHYNPAMMSFTKNTSNSSLHVDFIKQDAHNADTSWSTFISDTSQGFTHPGVERLNDSIRTYVWALLGAQWLTRTPILGAGTAFDAQKQFLANLEDAVSFPVDLPSAIKSYQGVLQYAGSEVNFVFGIGLYMAPSDMLLRIGRAVGYNNNIVIATGDQTLGFNVGLNLLQAPPSTDTGETGLVMPQEPQLPAPILKDVPTAAQKADAAQHADEKSALVVGGVAVGLLALWLLR